MSRARAIFFGTPEFAVAIFEALDSVADVVQVITQPDRPAGRGLRLTPCAVKRAAEARGISVLQPAKVRTAEFADALRALGCSIAVVAAYGRILPPAVLSAPRLGCLNVHASLLPRWRGAAPIQWAIAAGDRETGVCLMQMDEGQDTGPVFARSGLVIGEDETADEVSARLSTLGAELVRRELPQILDGQRTSEPQPSEWVTTAPLLEKEDGRVDWKQPARVVHDRIRAFTSRPGAFGELRGARVKLFCTHVVGEQNRSGPEGTVLGLADGRLEVACGRGTLGIGELQLEGRSRLTAAQFWAGRLARGGDRFGSKNGEGR